MHYTSEVNAIKGVNEMTIDNFLEWVLIGIMAGLALIMLYHGLN
jgi:hypothetical protein